MLLRVVLALRRDVLPNLQVHLLLLLRREGVVDHPCPLAKGVVHEQLRLELLDDGLLPLDHLHRVQHLNGVHLVLHVHHPGRQAQRGDGLLDVLGLAPDARDHRRAAVAPQVVLQDVRQLRLPIWNVLVAPATQRHHALLQVRQALIDAHALLLERLVHEAAVALLQRLLEPLRPREIHEAQLGRQHLLAHAGLGPLLDVHREDGVRSIAVPVEQVLRRGAAQLAGEEVVQRILLGLDFRLGEAPHVDSLSLAVLGDGELRLGVGVLEVAQQVVDALVVDLQVGARDANVHLWPTRHLREDVRQRSRRDAAVLVVLRVAHHGEGLARPGLAVRHQAAIDAVHGALHHVPGDGVVQRILRHVVQQLVEVEAEAVLARGSRTAGEAAIKSTAPLTVVRRRLQLHRHAAAGLVQQQLVVREGDGGPRADAHLDRVATHGADLCRSAAAPPLGRPARGPGRCRGNGTRDVPTRKLTACDSRPPPLAVPGQQRQAARRHLLLEQKALARGSCLVRFFRLGRPVSGNLQRRI
eukprot:scaffold876_cov243-Pinguiococcus_pyrenoidosus.AAC.43